MEKAEYPAAFSGEILIGLFVFAVLVVWIFSWI